MKNKEIEIYIVWVLDADDDYFGMDNWETKDITEDLKSAENDLKDRLNKSIFDDYSKTKLIKYVIKDEGTPIEEPTEKGKTEIYISWIFNEENKEWEFYTVDLELEDAEWEVEYAEKKENKKTKITKHILDEGELLKSMER